MKTEVKKSLRLRGEGGDELIASYDNRGDPYREGVDLRILNGYDTIVSVFLDDHEARSLRDLLNRLYPVGKS